MFERIISALLALAALGVAGVVVAREITDRRVGAGPADPIELRFQAEWEELLQAGRVIGPPGAPVQIVVFVDFECPACRIFHTHLRAIAEEFEGQVAMTLVHFPLNRHQYAHEAAHAAECAHAQGRFEEFVDEVFAGQEQFGARPWGAFAADAGVPRADLFEECMNDSDVLGAVDKGLELGRRIGVRGTPSLLVNEFWYSVLPSRPQLSSVIDRILRSQAK